MTRTSAEVVDVLTDDDTEPSHARFELVPETDGGTTALLYIPTGVNDTARRWGVRIVTPDHIGATIPVGYQSAYNLLSQRCTAADIESPEVADWDSIAWADIRF